MTLEGMEKDEQHLGFWEEMAFRRESQISVMAQRWMRMLEEEVEHVYCFFFFFFCLQNQRVYSEVSLERGKRGGNIHFGWCPKSNSNRCWRLREVGISGLREKLAIARIKRVCQSIASRQFRYLLGRLCYIGGVLDGGSSLQGFMLKAVLSLLMRIGEIRIEVLLSRDYYLVE